MSFELDGGFEDSLREAMLAEVEAYLADRAEQIVREATRDALVEAGYDADSILGELKGPEVSADSDSVRVAWTVDHEAAGFLEFGTSDHTIEGDPLVFDWPDAPPEVQAMFESTFPTVFFTEVEVSGVAETRHTRRALQALARDLQR
jgi:hypothetical protein